MRDVHVYVFLPVHNRREITSRLVDCLRIQSNADYHLLLIDDGSTDGTSELVSRELTNSTVLRGRGNWWWAGSLQAGIRWAKTERLRSDDIVVIMNDDTLVEGDFISRGVRLLNSTSNTIVAAQCYSEQTGELMDVGSTIDWRTFDMKAAVEGASADFLSTRGMFIRFGDMLRIGNFHPHVLPHYLSDYEYTHRARKLGYVLRTFPELKLWVNENSTGIHPVVPSSLRGCLRRFLSIRSSANIQAWIVFLFLASPRRWLLVNCYRVVRRSIGGLMACIRKYRHQKGSLNDSSEVE